MRALMIAGVVGGLLAAAAAPALAHQTSVKYVTLAVGADDPARIDVTVKVAPTDVTEPLQLAADTQPTAAAAAASPAVAPYVARWLTIATCTPTAPTSAVDTDARFVVVHWTAACAAAPVALDLDFSNFFAVDRKHIAIVRVTRGPDRADPIDLIVRAADSPAHVRLDERAGFVQWIRAGIAHIWAGVDHIAFVLALLLVVMLVRTTAPQPPGWALRTPLASLRRTAGVITAFTIAHSISLALASLGILTLAARPVEAMIAASIVYTAAEDIYRPDARTRFALTFGFGLVHGLGFANVLGEMLPPSDVALPLLGFNVGVEIGQLAIVGAALPILYLVSWALGAARYRRIALPILASAILALGLTFLVERVFGLHLTGM
nr:HupE/UreJ family protein [Kofleriaceae bacterium]